PLARERWSGLRIVIFLLILLFYTSLLAYGPNLPVADDMPRHVTNGKLIMSGDFRILYENMYSYTDEGHPFMNHHWFSGAVFYVLFSFFGWPGLVVIKIITYLAVFCLIFFAAYRKADFWAVAAFSLPAILILMERTSLRPEMWSYLFIAIVIYVLTDLD